MRIAGAENREEMDAKHTPVQTTEIGWEKACGGDGRRSQDLGARLDPAPKTHDLPKFGPAEDVTEPAGAL